MLSVLLRLTDSDCPYDIYWQLCWLTFFDLRILIVPMVSIGHCIVCPSSIYGFWLPLWYLLVIVLSVLLRFTDSDWPYGICWPLYCLSFFDLPMVFFGRFSDHTVENKIKSHEKAEPIESIITYYVWWPRFYTKYQSLCVCYYHNIFDDPGFTQSTSHSVYTIIILCLMTPVFYKVPVTVCILLL